MKNLILLLVGIIIFTACGGSSVSKQDAVVYEEISKTQEPARETEPLSTMPAESVKKLKNAKKTPETENAHKTTKPQTPSPTKKKTIPTPAPTSARYILYSVDSSELLDSGELSWADDLSFNIVQVEGMEDEVLQEKINKTILECMTHWVEDFESFNPDTISLITSDILSLTIYLQTDSYLSFNNRFDIPTSNNNWDSIHDVITIDMKTGERVMLDDLFKVDGSFATRVFTFAENLEYMIGYNYGSETLLEKLREASLNNLELDKKISTRARAMLSRTSFHLEPNKLVITFHYSGARELDDFPNFLINLDNLEDFLLVDKW